MPDRPPDGEAEQAPSPSSSLPPENEEDNNTSILSSPPREAPRASSQHTLQHDLLLDVIAHLAVIENHLAQLTRQAPQPAFILASNAICPSPTVSSPLRTTAAPAPILSFSPVPPAEDSANNNRDAGGSWLVRYIQSLPSQAVRAARSQVLSQIQKFAAKTATTLIFFLWARRLRKIFLTYAMLLLFKLQRAREGLGRGLGSRIIELTTKLLQ
ncbi:hypothetical protein HDU87_008858 [Geranomyces variabilis]|uniref:Uncharacterized protein n=1 Tax=Geranomyces variabilis TaxID=109894 RepID=A0AAD5XNZ2_9FUNG|nr:hypothetical protein HDU87_008858 [Geranomyces variabilis]